MCALYNGVYIDIGLFLCHAVRQPDKVNEILDISLRSFDRGKRKMIWLKKRPEGTVCESVLEVSPEAVVQEAHGQLD